MPVTIDEVTAEVATPERGAQPAPRAESQPTPPSELRRQHEHYERRCVRAARVKAD